MGIIRTLLSTALGIPTQSASMDPAAAAAEEGIPGAQSLQQPDAFGAAPPTLNEGQAPRKKEGLLGGLIKSGLGLLVSKVQDKVPVLGNIISLGEASIEGPKALFGLFDDKKSGIQKLNLAQNFLSDVIGVVNPHFDAGHDEAQQKATIGLNVAQRLGINPSENTAELITMGAGALGATDHFPSLKGLVGLGAGGSALSAMAGAGGVPGVPTFDA